MDAFLDKLVELCTTAGVKILIAILIYIVGKIIISKLMKMVDKMHSVSRLDETAKKYIRNIIKAVLYVVLVVAIISELGVPMASVITVLASAGVAVGMALQGSLANLAGGIMLLVFRPFNVGDYIMAGGEEGVVKSISTFYTVLNTVDNKEVSIPADPAPQVEPLEGIPGGLAYTVRVWCKSSDYWDVYFELMREIPTALGAAEISGPSTPVKVG